MSHSPEQLLLLLAADDRRTTASAMQTARLVVAGVSAVMSRDGQRGWREEWDRARKVVES